MQKRYEKKDGAYLWANVCASRIPAMAEDGAMLAVIVEDITRRMEAERSLAATRAELTRVARFTAMGELVASMALIGLPSMAMMILVMYYLSRATRELTGLGFTEFLGASKE